LGISFQVSFIKDVCAKAANSKKTPSWPKDMKIELGCWALLTKSKEDV
jgi:hypothetical protein